MKRLLYASLLVVLMPCFSIAQMKDTLSIMHYNILHYGNYFGGCTTTNNNVADKDGYLKDIIDATLPDIFTVNEMGANNVYARRIVQNALNQSGRDYYEQAVYSNNTNSSIVNMLFYNRNKVGLISQDYIDKGANNSDLVRRIDVYKLFYKDPFLSAHRDSVIFHVIVCHLSASDPNQRENETNAIANYLETKNMKGSYLLCGDLNVKRSSVQEYQNLVSNPLVEYALIDPINQAGSWTENAAFAMHHTQSTRTSGACHAGGGMDDRFDFILISNDVKGDSSGVLYLDKSYEAVGQDGLRLNQSLISPANTTYNAQVIQALYDMSDHLPVRLKLAVDMKDATSAEEHSVGNQWSYELKGKELIVYSPKNQGVNFDVYDFSGKKIDQLSHDGGTRHTYQFHNLESGLYILSFAPRGGTPKYLKLHWSK